MIHMKFSLGRVGKYALRRWMYLAVNIDGGSRAAGRCEGMLSQNPGVCSSAAEVRLLLRLSLIILFGTDAIGRDGLLEGVG